MRKKLIAIMKIFRPELPLAAGVCVLLGEVLALGGLPSLRLAVLGFISVFLVSGSALVLNDVFDLEVDRVNMPQRPLPSGTLSVREAVILTMVAIVLGLSAALMISFLAFVCCLITCAVGVLYNWKFKETGLAGNLMVSFSVGFTFVFGGIAVGDPWNKIVWCFALMAFLVDLGEEIAGDAMDMAGDQQRGSKSLALMYGRSRALTISAVLFGLVIAVSLVPFIFGWLGVVYLVMIVVMDGLVVNFSLRLLSSNTPEAGRAAMRGIYLAASAGMLAFLIGQLLG